MSAQHDTYVIRAANKHDLAEIDQLLGRSYPALLKQAYPPSTLVTAIPLISRAQPHLIASGTYFVVLDGDQIVGAGGWTRAAPNAQGGVAARIGHIRHVVTDHRRVRSGIGRRLMTHIFASAEEQGIRTLECFSTLMAEKFYASLGFKTIGPISVNLRQGVTFASIHMRRSL